MKTLLIALAMAITPVAIVLPVVPTMSRALAATTALGDLSAMQAIVSDSLTLAKSGDLTGAEKRITDYETVWDNGEAALRPIDTATWTALDHASDAAIEALRSGSPTAETAVPPLEALVAALGDPSTMAQPAAAKSAAFSLTNPDGSPVPCETALQELRRVSATKGPIASDQAKFDELQTKGIERCNADDDKRADNFFGEALALLNN